MEQAADHAGPDEVETALDRMLLSEAMAQLSEDHRAVISRAYYQGCDHRADRCRTATSPRAP